MVKDRQISVFEYTDYRQFLKNYYKIEKAGNRRFSLRYFSQRAGLKAKDHLQKVMNGKRNISQDTLPKFITGLSLMGDESKYFEALVKYNQARTDDERNNHSRRLEELLERRRIRSLSVEEHDYFSIWHIPAIRELIPCAPLAKGPDDLADRLMGEVDARQAAFALKLLEKLKLITRLKNGKLSQRERHLAAGDCIASREIKNYHRGMMDRAKAALDKSSADEREIQAVTMGVDSKKIPEAKRMINEFVAELRGFLTESEPDRVYQFNIQLFNLSDGGRRQ